MKTPLDPKAIEQLFTTARSFHAWTDQPVSDETIQTLYETLKWGPTSVNSNPARFTFIRTQEAKEKLFPSLMPSNVPQVQAAPVTVIIAYDENFTDHLGTLFPAYDAKSFFEGNPKLKYDTAFRNSSLQGAYLIMAARALGLDVCPLSGFDNEKLDQTFFAGTSLRSNFICTLGYGKVEGLYPRGPRLNFEQACRMV